MLLVAVVVAMPAGARPAAGAASGANPWKHVPGTPAATKDGHKAQVHATKVRAYTLDRGDAHGGGPTRPRARRARS